MIKIKVLKGQKTVSLLQKWIFYFLVLSLLLLIPFQVGARSTPQFKNNKGDIIPESIASLEKLILGGVEQWLLILGRYSKNPVLLFLHGGPGYPQISYIHGF